MSSSSSSTLTLDAIELWNCKALRSYLRLRGLKTSGRKKELQALVFAASQLNVPLKDDELIKEIVLNQNYSDLLYFDGRKIPDPLTELKEGWVGEKDGIRQWPPVTYFEIAEWLLTNAPAVCQPSKRPKTLRDRLLSDYKEGKAFSYFQSDWLKELFFHELSPEDNICVLKADCVPSQRVRNTPHKTWVAIEKETGKIRSAYCTCFAGLGSSCNHTAAVIFKLDNAFMTGASGVNTVPCTSKPCKWNVFKGPSLSQVLEGHRVCDLQWVKPNYAKGDPSTRNTVTKQLFNPTEARGSKPTSEGLVSALYASCKESSVFKYLVVSEAPPYSPAENFNTDIALQEEVYTSEKCPLSLPELASTCCSVDEFKSRIQPYTAEEIRSIEEATRRQSECEQWRKLRAGRITASNLRSVVTRNRTLKDPFTSLSKDPAPLIKRLMGYVGPSPHLPNLKYGRLMEPKARDFYRTLLAERGHQNVLVKETGLHVHKFKPFIAASPDALVDCFCCGEGILEIKCPRSIAADAPSVTNCEFLEDRNGTATLKRKHAYFMQVQTQLACTQRQWCDFFVYTQSGYHLERLRFDEEEWQLAEDDVGEFFQEFLIPELVERKIYQAMAASFDQPSSST